MILTREFLQIAGWKKFSDVNARFEQQLKDVFPEHAEIINENKIIRRRKECNELSIFTEKGIFRYLCVEYLFGESFYGNENFLKIFKQGLSGDQALKVFYLKLSNT
jgi:hypothetical protein